MRSEQPDAPQQLTLGQIAMPFLPDQTPSANTKISQTVKHNKTAKLPDVSPATLSTSYFTSTVENFRSSLLTHKESEKTCKANVNHYFCEEEKQAATARRLNARSFVSSERMHEPR